MLAYKLGLEELAPELDRFRDAYLEPWTRFRPRAELRSAFPAAYLLGGICRVLAWHFYVANYPPPADLEYADIVPVRLRLLLETLSNETLRS